MNNTTILLQKSIKFAIQTHEIDYKQKRKGKDIAYITHPLTVGLILSNVSGDIDIICSGILHDVIEDSIPEKKVTVNMLKDEFGGEVAQMVLDVTEQNKELSWQERKAQAIEHIKSMSHSSLLVKSADLVSNLSEILDDYKTDGSKIFLRFNAPKIDIIKNYLKTINVIISSWRENPLKDELIFLAKGLQMIEAVYFMSEYPADIIKYSDYNENDILRCPICDWQGSAKDSDNINTDSHFCMDVSCPICDNMLLVIEYPMA